MITAMLLGLAWNTATTPHRMPPAASPAIQEYALDAGHSIVEFTVGFAFTRVKGRFTQSRGTILYDPANVANSSISVVLDAKSIDTGWPHRDEHLRTSDFFDVERFPTIVFQSEHVRRSGDGWVVEGPLTMHGVTRPVAIPFRFVQPPTRQPESRWMILNAVGAVRIARKDFGILGGSAHNAWFTQARSATVADSVDVSLEIEGWLADAASQRSPGLDEALTRIRTDGVDAQLARWRRVRATTPEETFARYFHGGDVVVRGLIADGRVGEAVAVASGLLDLFPRLASAWLVSGYALSVAGDTAAAARQFARARAVFRPTVVDPNEKFKQDDEFWYYADQLVRFSLEWGRLREAASLAGAVASIYPDVARAHVTHAVSLALAGNTAAADAAFTRALALDPNETRALEWRRRLRG